MSFNALQSLYALSIQTKKYIILWRLSAQTKSCHKISLSYYNWNFDFTSSVLSARVIWSFTSKVYLLAALPAKVTIPLNLPVKQFIRIATAWLTELENWPLLTTFPIIYLIFWNPMVFLKRVNTGITEATFTSRQLMRPLLQQAVTCKNWFLTPTLTILKKM